MMTEELVEKCLKKGVLKVFTDILRLKRVVKEEATQQLLQLIGVMRKFVVLARWPLRGFHPLIT